MQSRQPPASTVQVESSGCAAMSDDGLKVAAVYHVPTRAHISLTPSPEDPKPSPPPLLLGTLEHGVPLNLF